MVSSVVLFAFSIVLVFLSRMSATLAEKNVCKNVFYVMASARRKSLHQLSLKMKDFGFLSLRIVNVNGSLETTEWSSWHTHAGLSGSYITVNTHPYRSAQSSSAHCRWLTSDLSAHSSQSRSTLLTWIMKTHTNTPPRTSSMTMTY